MHTCIMSNFSFTLKKLKLKYSNNLRNRKFNNHLYILPPWINYHNCSIVFFKETNEKKLKTLIIVKRIFMIIHK